VNGTDTFLELALGAFALVWLGLALYVLLTRLIYDLGGALLDRVRKHGVQADLRYAGDPEALLRRLPRRILERTAADPATPRPAAALLAGHVLERHPADIIRLARAPGRRRRWRRIRALRILTLAGWHSALPLLEEAVESGDEDVVAAAVAMLGSLGNRRSAEVLSHALRTQRFSRSRIAAQLDESRMPIADLLLPLLEADEQQLRFWGATLLSRYAGREEVATALGQAAADPDPSVRAAAVESLAVGESSAATTTAVALVRDPVWFVRAHAARALRGLEGTAAAAVAPLLADESWWVRAAAKETLEACPAVALEVLVDYLDHVDPFARNGAAEVLQNTGVLDALLSAGEARRPPDGPGPDTLRRILAAGGPRLTASAAARNGLDGEELQGLAASGG
jgi:HEAT repeat protein